MQIYDKVWTADKNHQVLFKIECDHVYVCECMYLALPALFDSLTSC